MDLATFLGIEKMKERIERIGIERIGIEEAGRIEAIALRETLPP